jgi:hypothetical protein
MEKYNKGVHKMYTKDMNLESYIKYYNEVLYPLNYPYYLRTGLRTGESGSLINEATKGKLSIIVQIGIPKVDNSTGFDIDKPTNYDFVDLLTVYGDTDQEIINILGKIEWGINHKEYFKKLWTINSDS